MYHNSYEFGKAYQAEMLREAGVKDGQVLEGQLQSRPQRQGMLSRIFGGLFGRKTESKPAPIVSIQKTGRTVSG